MHKPPITSISSCIWRTGHPESCETGACYALGALNPALGPMQDLQRKFEDCIAEFMWQSLVFYRQWGVQARDLVRRSSEWYALLM